MNVINGCMEALSRVDLTQITRTLEALRGRRDHNPKARVFCIGNGGGYAHAAHFAADLRKIAHMPALSFDNAGEMTARINDDGWDRAWSDWMQVHRFNHHDVLFVFSVGGSDEHSTSVNLYDAIQYARGSWTEALDRALILGIVGQEGGHLAEKGEPIVIPSTSTPVVEGCQSVIAHHLVQELTR